MLMNSVCFQKSRPLHSSFQLSNNVSYFQKADTWSRGNCTADISLREAQLIQYW